jgi:hypothetical protein
VLGAGAAQTRRPFPAYGDITWNIGDGRGTYHSLQSKLERRLSRGLQSIVAYTWQKAMNNVNDGGAGDTGNQNAYIRDELGLAGHNRAHRFTASLVYDVPFQQVFLRNWQRRGVHDLDRPALHPRAHDRPRRCRRVHRAASQPHLQRQSAGR